MNSRAVAEERPRLGSLERAATVTCYSALGAALLVSRVARLDHSFWTDEIIALEEFVRSGPREILAGDDLSHELFGLSAWLTRAAVGESEIAMRVWSVVPFLAGVGLTTGWLHRRSGALAGILFLFLATVSPLLLDVTRQARGYGLAFLAMSALVVSALEASRTRRTAAVVGFCAAGLVGTATLPQFGIAFVAAGGVLASVRPLRGRVVIGLAVSLFAIVAFYAPHLGQVRGASQIEDGVRIDTLWLLTAPIDQILLPALIWIDGTALVAGAVWVPAVLVALFVMASSPLARATTTALLLASGPVATVAVLWLAQAYVVPRYVSYLLVPLFVLLATGAASILSKRGSATATVATAICVAGIAVLGFRFATLAPDVIELPREANRDAAQAVLDREPPRTTVLAYMRNPRNLEHYLGRPVAHLEPSAVARQVCGRAERVAYVTQPFGIRPVDVSCLRRADVEHLRFAQYARGGAMDVWFVPPARP